MSDTFAAIRNALRRQVGAPEIGPLERFGMGAPTPAPQTMNEANFSGSERVAQALRGVLGNSPTAERFINGVSPVVSALTTDVYDDARKVAQGGNPAMLAMSLLPGAKPVAKAAQTGVKTAENALAKGIRAYHGSPHDFDRFDMSKIGTGEGAQAYGHGLYFAEAEDVAKQYRDKLAGADLEGSTGNANVDSMLRRMFGGDWEAAKASGYLPADEVSRIERDGLVPKARPQGRLYEVNIKADTEDFLDWDKPLSEQPKAQAALRSLRLPPGAIDDLGGDLSLLQNAERPQDAYDTLSSLSGVGDVRGASQALREAGIPGIRYLDQGSRTAGEGSRNYVVFDDNLIEILRKYGLLPPAAVGGAAMAGQSGEAQAMP